MDDEVVLEQHVPSGKLVGIEFSILTESVLENYTDIVISLSSDVTSSKLGMPNQSLKCSTCGGSDTRTCDGHFGYIRFSEDILHPFLLSEVAGILNKICPRCKSVKRQSKDEVLQSDTSRGCKYCMKRTKSMPWYPKLHFKVVNKSAVVVEVRDSLPKTCKGKSLSDIILPEDYWDFIVEDTNQEKSSLKPYSRTLSPHQAHELLLGVDSNILKKFVCRKETLFLTSLPVTPNCNRVMESTQGHGMTFDDGRTRCYKKMADFRNSSSELALRAWDCLNACKLNTKSNKDDNYSKFKQQNSKDSTKIEGMRGIRWIKNVVTVKRTDNIFRMIVVGDPNLKLGEIGLSRHIAEKLEIAENLNTLNWQKLSTCCNMRLLEKGEIKIKRRGNVIHIRNVDKLQTGDVVYRPLEDGDIVLINRPPSVHQHSVIGLTVKVHPTASDPTISVVSLNPILCSPFKGDFDGDCLHGYIPQSVESRVELKELVALDQQLFNGQNGQSLLSLCHDSLCAAYLVREKGIVLSKIQMQQLLLLFPPELLSSEILIDVESQMETSPSRTGDALLCMLMPHVRKGDTISSSQGNLFSDLLKHYSNKAISIAHTIQEVLLDLISITGLTVSLSDLYLCPDSTLREKMIEEVRYGLQDAEQSCHNKNSVEAFKDVFRDINSLPFRYASRDNSILSMIKSGSKGSVPKFVQQSLCLGLQQPAIPLSFGVPSQLSCDSWNHEKLIDLDKKSHYIADSTRPFAIVKSSFMDGLNPLECFVHSISSRDGFFGKNADIPGTLTRKLMNYMRDLHIAYDRTVRSLYGNQLIQFSYATLEDNVNQMETHRLSVESAYRVYDVGSPVGLLAACAVSEAAYGALEQPGGTHETSPLEYLKKVLESGQKKVKKNRSMSVYLSKEAIRWHGAEHAYLKVKGHLESVLFSDVVSTVSIRFSEHNSIGNQFSPWVCHFHISEERMKKRGLTEESIREALYSECKDALDKPRLRIPKLRILHRCCSDTVVEETKGEGIKCITVECETSAEVDHVRDVVIPFLLERVIKGFLEFKEVGLMWKHTTPSISRRDSSYEPYLKVSLIESYVKGSCWTLLLKKTLKIADLIDWKRSQPDDTYDVCSAFGISSASKFFERNLELAISDTGKTILPEHLELLADALSVTGEIFGLSQKGLTKQMDLTSTSSPFAQACFNLPKNAFIKAAKKEVQDDLLGAVDAIAWGKKVPVGTGGQFDLIYSQKGHELSGPMNVYSALPTLLYNQGKDDGTSIPAPEKSSCDNWKTKNSFINCDPKAKGHFVKAHGMNYVSDQIVRWTKELQDILYK